METIGGVVLVGLGGSGVIFGGLSVVSGIALGSVETDNSQVNNVAGATRAAFIGLGLLSGIVGFVMVKGGLALFNRKD